MTALRRQRRISAGVDVALAFGAGAASFALAAVTIVAAGSGAWVVALGVLYGVAIVAMFRRWGVEYAVPAAVAVLLAYDWYYVPPTHGHGFPDAADLAVLLVYLVAGVLIGELAAHAARRADVSESARSELAEEQAALRRVATRVARGESPDAVFAAVAEEAGVLLDLDGARVVRFVGDDEILQLEGWTPPGHDRLPVGRLKLEHTSLSGEVLRTGRTVRIEDYRSIEGALPWFWQQLGIRSGVAAPIIVDGRLWGAMLAWSLQARLLPENAESRLAGFTELVATAISNTASREELALLARGQAALRRVATLVASGVAPSDVFATVAREVGLLLGVNATHIARYEGDGTVTGVGGWSADGGQVSVGARVTLDDTSVTSLVFASGRPARMDSYDDASADIADLTDELGIRSAVGAPVVVDGHLWGAVIASSNDPQPLAADTELRIAAFTELVAAAISNTEARVEVGRLAEEQAALRRVATLVARQASSTEVFTKVAEEVGRLLGAESAWMLCHEPDGGSTLVAMWGELDGAFQVGMQLSVEGDNVAARVRRTWRTARIDDYASITGALGAHARETGVRSAVGSPIVVEGRLWGSMTAVTLGAEPLPADAESRIEEFTELVATSISNMQARSDLAASRARIVAAADEERRRVVRDLHDGAQQRLVHTVVTLKLARRALEEDPGDAPAVVDEALQHAEEATAELRELAHGILPSVLTRGGLRAGVGALASRMHVPVDIGVSVERLPLAVEATAYFIVAEALTNVAKHSHANRAAVTARVTDGTLQVQVRDDGVGGAQPDGSGLLGLGDRLAALDGSLRVESPVDGGTLIAAAIPFR
ncbi:MAG: sensor signal transduction histidine kinase [Solirubrobacterales bacterium]|nr:sensor signal transduction histidine kinase [Solirubrobacterales bacterium]